MYRLQCYIDAILKSIVYRYYNIMVDFQKIIIPGAMVSMPMILATFWPMPPPVLYGVMATFFIGIVLLFNNLPQKYKQRRARAVDADVRHRLIKRRRVRRAGETGQQLNSRDTKPNRRAQCARGV